MVPLNAGMTLNRDSFFKLAPHERWKSNFVCLDLHTQHWTNLRGTSKVGDQHEYYSNGTRHFLGQQRLSRHEQSCMESVYAFLVTGIQRSLVRVLHVCLSQK